MVLVGAALLSCLSAVVGKMTLLSEHKNHHSEHVEGQSVHMQFLVLAAAAVADQMTSLKALT